MTKDARKHLVKSLQNKLDALLLAVKESASEDERRNKILEAIACNDLLLSVLMSKPDVD